MASAAPMAMAIVRPIFMRQAVVKALRVVNNAHKAISPKRATDQNVCPKAEPAATAALNSAQMKDTRLERLIHAPTRLSSVMAENAYAKIWKITLARHLFFFLAPASLL